MDIVERNVHELIPYENNPRINDSAIEKVAESIMEFGFKVPIVIDKKGVVIAGHTRLAAAKKLEMDVVPCTVAEDLSEEQIRAYRLADNKTAELAEWDFDLLRNEIVGMEDIEKFGFEELIEGEDLVSSSTKTKTSAGVSEKEDEEDVIRCPRCGSVVSA